MKFMNNASENGNIIYIEIRGQRVTAEKAAEVRYYYKCNYNDIFSQIDWIKKNGIIRGCGQVEMGHGQLSREDIEYYIGGVLTELAHTFPDLSFVMIFTYKSWESFIDTYKDSPYKEIFRLNKGIDYFEKEDRSYRLNEYGKRKLLCNLSYGAYTDEICAIHVDDGRIKVGKGAMFLYWDNEAFYDVNVYNDNLYVDWNSFQVKYNRWFKETISNFGKVLNIRGKHIEDKNLIRKIRKVSYTEKGETLADYNFINDEGDIYLNTEYSRSWECGEMVIYYDMQRLARQLESLEMLVVISKNQKDILGTADLVIWICEGKWKVIRDRKLIEKVFRSYENSCQSLAVRVVLDLDRETVQVNEYHMGSYDDFVLGWIKYQREKLSKDCMTRFLDSMKNSI